MLTQRFVYFAGIFSLLFAHSTAIFAGETESIGAFIVPTHVEASSAQISAGRAAETLINGAGLYEKSPGVWLHTHDFEEGGRSTMWNADGDDHQPWLNFDLGRSCHVRGLYIWNYGGPMPWVQRGVKQFDVEASQDGKTYQPVASFSLQPIAEGDIPADALKYPAVIDARFFKLKIQKNFWGQDWAGLSEVRFADAEREKTPPPVAWRATYPRTSYSNIEQGHPPADEHEMRYPPNSGVIDVTKPPYNAVPNDGKDDTAAIQQALTDHANDLAIIYLPNGVYDVSNTLTWSAGMPGPSDDQKETILQGQSVSGTILRLKDSAAGFADPRRPKSMVWTGQAPAQRFGNEISNVTFDTGANNPGAIGVQFIANNQGAMRNVNIVSGDGQGVIGLDLGYTDEQGPCLISNVGVKGFDIGISNQHPVDSVVFEHIRVEHQNTFGFVTVAQPVSIRDFESSNGVPALSNSGALVVLVEAKLQGTAGTGRGPAIVNDGHLFLRDAHVAGYAMAVENHAGSKQNLAGGDISEWTSAPAQDLFNQREHSLRLPIKETPLPAAGDPAAWANVADYGAVAGKTDDASPAIQRAIDSGASTVYFPRGVYSVQHSIVVRGKVARLIGGKAAMKAPPNRQPIFIFADGDAPVVAFERIIDQSFNSPDTPTVQIDTKRTIVFRSAGINKIVIHQAATLFFDDAVVGYGQSTQFLPGEEIWARQFNPETAGVHVINDGATFWCLGLKTEGEGTLVETRNGGRTEILGGLAYNNRGDSESPLLIVTDSQMSASLTEASFFGRPYQTIVQETQLGVQREIKAADWDRSLTLFRSGMPRAR